jgi:U32 family peptidase
LNYYKKTGIAHVLLEAGKVNANDEIIITGETTGVVELKLVSFMKNDLPDESAEKGEEITFVCESLIRPRDQVYLVKNVGVTEF